MPLEPFEAPLLRLRRGRHHVEDLDRNIADFARRIPIYRNARLSPMPGFIESEVIIRETPPQELALILGDAIHSLRVCLDLLANDLVRLEGGDTKGVYFPFAKSEAELPGQIASKKFCRASPVAIDLLKRHRPYNGGNNLLRGLHDLDVQDKHQMVTPIIGNVRYPGGGVGVPGLEATTGVIIQTTLNLRAYGPEAGVIGEEIPVAFDVLFPFFGPFDSQSVVPTLQDLVGYVFDILQDFAKLYNRHLSL